MVPYAARIQRVASSWLVGLWIVKLAPARSAACISELPLTMATIVELLLGDDLRAALTTRVGLLAAFQSTITASSLLWVTASRAGPISAQTSVSTAKLSKI